MLWQLSEHDLATLDSAEGVPLRYRRDRMIVHTDSGPASAWVYIDHRVTPARPARAISNASSPAPSTTGCRSAGSSSCADGTRRSWPSRRTSGDSAAPQTLSELLADPGVFEVLTLRSRFGFLAIHGGGLEQMTDVIAQRAAEAAGASVYTVRHPDGYPHHLASARYRPDESRRLAAFLDHVDVAVSLHGYGRAGRGTHLLAGGANRELAAHLAFHLQVPGHHVVTDPQTIPRELRGMHPDNPVNLVRHGGVQLELPARVRGLGPRSPLPEDDGLAPATSALVQGLVAAAHSWPLSAR